MKAFWTVLILVIIIVGAIFLTKDKSDQAMMDDDTMMEDPNSENGQADSMMENDAMDDDSMMESDDSMMMEEGEKHTFDISGKNFEFDLAEIRVKEGDTVTINFTSESGFHDWVVDEFDAATDQVRPDDGVTSVTFVADQKGTFEYYCSVGSHRANGMVGNLIVE